MHLFLVSLVAGFICILNGDQSTFTNYDEVGLSFLLPARGRDCFYQRVTDPKHKYVEFSYQVVSGGDLDVNVNIFGPHGEQIVSEIKKTDGTHKIDVLAANRGYGDYSICIDNSFSYQTSKLVCFLT